MEGRLLRAGDLGPEPAGCVSLAHVLTEFLEVTYRLHNLDYCGVNDEVCFGDFNVLLQMQKLELQFGKFLLCGRYACLRIRLSFIRTEDLHTHFRVAVLALSTTANKGVEPGLDTGRDESMQAFVWCVVATEQVEHVHLCCQWC